MLYRPAPPRPLRPDRRPSTVAITGVSIEKLERLIEEIVQRAIRNCLAELEDRVAGRHASWVAEDGPDAADD